MNQHAVVIAAYNAEATIERALDSVAAQRLLPAEIHVVDDGSTDTTAARVEAWSRARRQPGLYLHRQANAGAGAARNLAIERASAAWLSFLDADDAWLPDKIVHVERAIMADPAPVMVHTDLAYHDLDGRRREGCGFDAAKMTDPAYLCSDFRFKTSTVSIDRRFLRERGFGFGEERTSEDYRLFWQLLLEQGRVGYIARPDTVVYSRSDSLTRSTPRAGVVLDNIAVLSALIDTYDGRPAAAACRAALKTLRYRLAQQVVHAEGASIGQAGARIAGLWQAAGTAVTAKAALSRLLSSPRPR